MPRRTKADPYAQAVGRRIRELRLEAELTIEQLAVGSRLNSKGHLSSIERGLVMITVQTLKSIADGLGVLPADLLTAPGDGPRGRLLDASRKASAETIKRLLRDAEAN